MLARELAVSSPAEGAMADRPLHEVVLESNASVVVDGPRGQRMRVLVCDELAAVLKAADESVAAARAVLGWIEGHAHVEEDEIELTCNAYDAAVADLRRALEGK